MFPKISNYLEMRFGSTQNGIEFLQFAGWLLCIGITLPVMTSVLISPVIALIVVLLFVLGIVWLVIMWKRGLSISLSPIDTGMFAVLFAVIVTTYFSIDPSRGMRMVWRWSALILLFYIMLTLFRSGILFYPFVKALLVVTAAFVFFGYFDLFVWLYNWYSVREWPLMFPSRIYRVVGLFDDPVPFGELLGMTLVLAIILFAEFKQYRSFVLRVWLVATTFLLIITQARGAWTGVFVSLSLYALSKAWDRSIRQSFSWKIWGVVFSLIIGGVVTLFLLLSVLRPATFAVDNSLSIRLGLWDIAFDIWRQHFWTGGGPNSFPTFELMVVPIPYEHIWRTAHNFYINVAAEMGLVGLTAVFILMAQIIWLWWRRWHPWNPWTAVFFTPLIAFAVYMQFDTPWLQVMVLSAVFLAGFVATLTPEYGEDKRSFIFAYLPYFWIFVWICLVGSGITGWKIIRQYENVVINVINGDWEAASNASHTGQALTPYADSLFLFTSGFNDGVLASEDNSYLASAIENQEQLITLEPGWSAHYANLAGLYRQAGRDIEAIETMKQAISRTPDIPLYYLNLGLWYEEDGDIETAVSIYRQLYELPHTWHDAPFWSTPIAMQAVTQNADDVGVSQDFIGYNMLKLGQTDEALESVQNAIIQRQSPNNYLGLGIAQLYAGDVEHAAESFTKADALLSVGVYKDVVGLWQATLPTAPDEALPSAIAELQHYYSINEMQKFTGAYTLYTRSMFEREPVPYELLPQLSCFTFSTTTGLHMQLLQKWYLSQGDMINADFIQQFLSGDGVRSCMPFPSSDNKKIR